MPLSAPVVMPTEGFLRTVRGTFYRAVDRRYAGSALLGSVRDGRYSRAGQSTLYLSASRAGVAAAMIAHAGSDDPVRTVLRYQVDGRDIFDLRDRDAAGLMREKFGAPFADWRELAASGACPPSWHVRDWIEAQGAQGLIDPSRKAPGQWHLILFRWNVAGAPTVRARADGER